MSYPDAAHLQRWDPRDDATEVEEAVTRCDGCGEPAAQRRRVRVPGGVMRLCTDCDDVVRPGSPRRRRVDDGAAPDEDEDWM